MRWLGSRGPLLELGLALLVGGLAGCGGRSREVMPGSSDAVGGAGPVSDGNRNLTCGPHCTVRLTRRVQLRPPNDTLDFFNPLRVATTPDGGYVVAPSLDRAHLFVFDSTGRLTHVAGRRGQGPGEFQWIVGVAVDSAGIVAAADLFLRRITLFDPTGRLLGTATVPHLTFGDAFETDGAAGLLINATVGTPDRFGYAAHMVSEAGTMLTSFDESADGARSGSIAMSRVFSAVVHDTFWIARRLDPTLSEWTTSGRRLRDIDLRLEWFPVPTVADRNVAGRGMIDQDRPIPWVAGLGRNGSDLLVLVRRARADWSPSAMATRRGTGERGAFDVAETLRYVEFRLVVISAADGTVIGGVTLPGYYAQLIDNKFLVELVPGPDGRLSIRIDEVHLGVSR